MILREKGNLTAAIIGFEQLKVCADNQLNALAFGCLVRFDKTKKIISIRYRNRRHISRSHRLHERTHANKPINQGKFGVNTKVNERGGHTHH